MRVLLICVALVMGKPRAEIESEFLVSPNPAHEFFKIIIPVDFGHCLVDVFNEKGKIVYTNPFMRKGETTINCRDWLNGLYVVVIQADDICKRYKLMKN